MNKKAQRYRLIDAFSGAGGASLGFSDRFGHPFDHVWANDFDQACVKTYAKNFGPVSVCGDIVEILADPRTKIPRADVVVGGVPCQGWSLLNKQRNGDPRRQLWRPFLEIVRRSKASIFVIENVPQILDSDEFCEIAKAVRSMGFSLASAKICAADYGVPQVRWRAVIIGCRFADPTSVFPPPRTYVGAGRRALYKSNIQTSPDALPWRTVKDAIGDLPPKPVGHEIRDIQPPLDLHFGRNPTAVSLKRYMAVPPGGNRFDLQRNAPEITPACWVRKVAGGTDLFGRLWWDRPSVTMRTEFFKPEKGRYLHPKQHRPITHREAARLQSFPDDFKFVGTKIEVAKQIGNAVPPVLAAKIAECVLALLNARK